MAEANTIKIDNEGIGKYLYPVVFAIYIYIYIYI